MIYPEIDPIAFKLGPIVIGWYGLMYLFGFIGGWLIARQQCKRRHSPWTSLMVDDVVFYIAMGVILGGRLGFILFYKIDYYLVNPLSIFKVWQGGMSFHGGLLGVTVAMFMFAKKYKLSIFTISDFVAPCVPPGLAFGRLGNFINSELWGKVTTSSLGMTAYDSKLGVVNRYPTQLLESLLEGVVLGLILWFVARKKRPAMLLTGLFLALYAVFRMLVELFRAPDDYLGYLYSNWLTMGHILSFPMLIIGLVFIILAIKRSKHE